MGDYTTITIRLPVALRSQLKTEAERVGMSLSEYARRQLAVGSPMQRVEAKLDLVLAHLDALPPAPDPGTTVAALHAVEPTPSERPMAWSTQHRQMVELDADGREIPP